MDVRAYLPSAKFIVLVAALVISVGLIYAAEYVAHPHAAQTAQLQNIGAGIGAADTNWQQDFASSTVFQTDNSIASQADQLSQAVQTGNLTESIGRSLLINTAAAQGQGLGADQPTQDQIVSSALSQIQGAQAATSTYSAHTMTITGGSPADLHAYGNALAAVIAKHPKATYNSTMLPVTFAIDNSDPSTLSQLPAAAREYRAFAADIIRTPAPASLSNSELQIANNYSRMADSITDLQMVLSDPTRGLLGMQTYASLFNTNEQLFIQIAGALQKNAILFTKDEPGHVWSVLYSASQQ